ncbi:small ribosomal subunit Rsm22 family protein [Bdellovibrio sp. HCB2-146]|uniref:small ribosomal subunit Rsm22 family protein n=1 Tax=Bdellovibrio sp. HCB2-146 TaxID=3394362 RepID=UPI0039BD8C19
MQRFYGVSPQIEESISKALKAYGLSLYNTQDLAKAVLALSDYFIANPDKQTPWHERWAQIAYLCYYLPLNMARLSAVTEEGRRRDFFKDLDHVIDFGAGLATASLVLAQEKNFKFTLIERANEPAKLIDQNFAHFKATKWQKTMEASDLILPKKSLAVFSYSLTELTSLPKWALECEAMMLVEPSTQQDGRKLLILRRELLEKGYHIYAPCTHEEACPLLTQSKTDWCHDRFHFQAPDWFTKMEAFLPMKNRTLTMSYLLVRKTKPATEIKAARVVGDLLKEKGKDRQMICQGTDREFLAWMHRKGQSQEIPRGVLIELPEDQQKVSAEIRVEKELKILK